MAKRKKVTKNEIEKQRYELVPIDSITTWELNPNLGNSAAIGASIEANGFYGAVYVQASTKKIVAGNFRYQAALEAGATQIPAIFLDIDDDRALRIFLADNKTRDDADTDNVALLHLLKRLDAESGGLIGTGFDEAELKAIINDLEPAFVPRTNPQVSTTEYTPEDLAKANIEPNTGSKTLVEVYCPHCTESFFIDPDSLGEWKPKE